MHKRNGKWAYAYLLHDIIAVRHCGVTYGLLAQKNKEGIEGMDGVNINSHALKVQTDTRSRDICLTILSLVPRPPGGNSWGGLKCQNV